MVLNTKWSQIVVRRPRGFREPHYSVCTRDNVAIVAVNRKGHLLREEGFCSALKSALQT